VCVCSLTWVSDHVALKLIGRDEFLVAGSTVEYLMYLEIHKLANRPDTGGLCKRQRSWISLHAVFCKWQCMTMMCNLFHTCRQRSIHRHTYTHSFTPCSTTSAHRNIIEQLKSLNPSPALSMVWIIAHLIAVLPNATICWDWNAPLLRASKIEQSRIILIMTGLSSFCANVSLC
jgi:hypothetical protein